MLTVTRKPHEKIRLILPDGRTVTIVSLPARRANARLGFEAPEDVTVLREEIYQLRSREEREKRGPAA